MATNSIKTAKIERRKLWFESIDDLLVELDRIERAAENGTLNVNGNWTAGQILAHLSNWIEYGWNGYPVKSPPFFLKWITVRMGHRFIRKGMPAGQKIPGTKEGTFGQEKIETAEGLRRLRKNLERLQNGEVAKFDSPAFGPLSHEDRIQLNLRHAELHLSFLNY
jgi:hypothetical protein